MGGLKDEFFVEVLNLDKVAIAFPEMGGLKVDG
jgi:hypothetical protein